jgi:lysophospholipase L1-like esterase
VSGCGGAALFALVVLTTTPADARTVLCFGDSTSWRYPARLQALHADWHVVSAALPGDVSSSLARLVTLLSLHRPDDVVIMIGTNDVVRRRDGDPVLTDDPRVTTRNIRRLALRSRHAGARVVVLTQTPASCFLGCVERQAHTREVAHRLVAWGLDPPHGIEVADLRDELTIHDWRELSDDGLHPNAAGAELIARYVGTWLDRRE